MSSSPSAAASPVPHPLRTSETLALVLGVANLVFLTGRKTKGLNHSLCLQAAPPTSLFPIAVPTWGVRAHPERGQRVPVLGGQGRSPWLML